MCLKYHENGLIIFDTAVVIFGPKILWLRPSSSAREILVLSHGLCNGFILTHYPPNSEWLSGGYAWEERAQLKSWVVPARPILWLHKVPDIYFPACELKLGLALVNWYQVLKNREC